MGVLTLMVGRDEKCTLKSRLAALVDGFADADDAVVEKLLDGSRLVTLHRDNFIFHAGDLCEAFLILLDGRVRVQLTSAGGRQVTLYRIGPGGSCLLTTSCLLSEEHYPAEAVAEADIEALAIPTSVFQASLENSGWFRKFVFDGFSSRLTNVVQRIEEITFTSIDARLAAALLQLDDKGETEVTHQQLALELGTAREVVSRHLKRFEAEGWVRLGRGRITVLDSSRIEALAAPALGD